MARLQILELPEGANDERRPFALIVDQMPADDATFEALRCDLSFDIAERIGARAVLAFETTVDIPANDIPISPAPIEGAFLDLAEQIKAGARHSTERYSEQPAYQYSDGGQAAKNLPLLLRAENAETRLKYARQVLIKDGYFTADEIGDDIAPRLVEWLSHHRQLAENFQGRALAAQERIREIKAAYRNALGLDNDESINELDAARDMRRELDQSREAIRSVLHAHRGEGYQGKAICVHCSALDDQGSTGNAPVAYPCDTVARIQEAFGEAGAPEPGETGTK